LHRINRQRKKKPDSKAKKKPKLFIPSYLKALPLPIMTDLYAKRADSGHSLLMIPGMTMKPVQRFGNAADGQNTA